MKASRVTALILVLLSLAVFMPVGVFAADPPAPTLTLASDTGVADDYITCNGIINVGNIQPGATWQYSINGGTSWNDGSGSSFTLSDGTYNAGTIKARQTLSGSTSADASNANTIVIASNLISNGDFQLGNTGFTTSYTYSVVPNIEPGLYAVPTRANDVHSYWTSQYDHTFGNSSGKYFVANGSSNSSDVVWQSTSGITVKAGQAYRFEAYLMSLIGGNPVSVHYPIVKFQLGDGATWVDLGTSNVSWTINESGIWHLIYADGQFSNDGTYYIRFLNMQTNASGYNDLGVDDIYFGLRGAAPSASNPGTNPTSTPTTFDTSSFLSLALHSDTGNSSTDKITSNGQVDVTGLQYAWEYSTNNGSTWTAGSGSSFTLSGDGLKSVIVHQRNAGNTAWLAPSAPFDFTLDTTPPSLSSAVVDSNILTLTYNENLDTDNPPVLGSFAVAVNGGIPVQPIALNVSGSSITLTLANVVYTGQIVTVSYVAPSGDNATKDVAGNKAANLSGQAVTNNANLQAPTYAVTYNGNENTSGTPPTGQTKTYNVILTLATNTGGLAKTGYTFSGWNTAADGSGTSYAAGASYTANAAIIFYAMWTRSLIGTGAQTSYGSSSSTTAIQANPPISLPNIYVQSAKLSDRTVAPGTPVTVTAAITNDGTINGNKKVTVYINGTEEASQGVTVNSGSTTTVTFDVSRNEPGTYTVYVGGTQAGSFTVDQFTPDTILFISSAMVFFALVTGVIYMTRRRAY